MSGGLKPIEWRDGTLYVLNQLELPGHVKYNPRNSVAEVFRAIRDMELRGAPLIGIAAAYGLCLGVRDLGEIGHAKFMRTLRGHAEFLASARPTGANLSWVLDRMLTKVNRLESLSVCEKRRVLEAEANRIFQEDAEICKAIGENFLTMIGDGVSLLTHCNAGSLATAAYGTATAPMFLAKERGWSMRVYVDETRPYLQGARLTTLELQSAGIDVTLICDSAAGVVLSQGKVDAVITGTDRVAANGDVANKVGTLSLAILAHYFKVPFYVAAPTPTIDMDTPSGKQIPIEERKTEEVTRCGGIQTAPEGTRAYNPAFDVTPHELVTAIVTERGIVTPPYSQSLPELFD